MQTELQSVISGSQRLVNPKNIQVSVDGQTVVLRGTAADEHDRILAGAIIGMSPGVYDIRNEIKVQTPVATPPGVTPAGQQP
jgi:osmotically-inducible protein OsmY